jgi:hypothetical protein
MASRLAKLALALWLLALSSCAGTPALAQARLDNLVSGSASATGTSATTIIVAFASPQFIYVTAVQCGRTDAGTSAIHVTFSDTASTVMVIPNTSGGGANNMIFQQPLTVAADTAFTFTSSASTSTVYCNAQGFTGN